MAKVTKTAAAIATMNANSDKPMDAVLPLIAAASGVDLRLAKNYYLWAIRQGLAAGTIPGKAAAAPKAPKAKVEKVAKVKAAPKKAVKAPKAPVVEKAEFLKSPDEVAKIKAANLKRMQEVTAKRKYNQVARPETSGGVENFDPVAARAMVNDYMNGNDAAFDNEPRFLTKSEVKALV